MKQVKDVKRNRETEKGINAIGYAAICRALTGPLQAFLDHPFTDKKYARQIADLIGDIFNGDAAAVGSTQGGYAAGCLLLTAKNYEDAAEPDWLQPLTFFLARAFESDDCPEAFHNEVIDKLDCYISDHLPDSPGDTVRNKLADAIRHNMASEAESKSRPRGKR